MRLVRLTGSTVHGIDALLHEPTEAPSGENKDLWHAAADLLRTTTAGTFQIRWIPAHLHEADCESPFEEWVACGNNQADHAAVAANRNRSADFVRLRSQAKQFFKHWAGISDALERIYLRIAQCTRAQGENLQIDEQEEPDPAEQPNGPPVQWHDRQGIWADHLPEDWTSFGETKLPDLPSSFLRQFFEWLLALDGQSEACVDVSMLELVLFYPHGAGQAFPIATPDGKYEHATHVAPFARPTVASLLRLVSRVLAAFARHFSLEGFLSSGIDRSFLSQKSVRIGCDMHSIRAMRQLTAVFNATHTGQRGPGTACLMA